MRKEAKSAALKRYGRDTLKCCPNVLIRTDPIISGDLASFDDDVITVLSSEGTINYNPSIANIFPVRIELEWRGQQSNSYYGETSKEYGGEPFCFPDVLSSLVISAKSPGEWKIQW